MDEISVKHIEAVVRMQQNLRLRDTRQLFAVLRQYSPDGEEDYALSSAFLPRFALTTAEVGFAYIINAPSRNQKNSAKKNSSF